MNMDLKLDAGSSINTHSGLPYSGPSPRRVISGLLGVQIVFSLGYILSKVLVEHFPPLIWGWIRSAITSFFLLIITLLMKRPHPKWDQAFFVPLFVLSLLGGVLTQAFFLVGLKYTTSTNSAVLHTLTPLVTLMTVILIGREKATPLRLFGFAVSFCGVLVLSGAERIKLTQSTLIGDLLSLGSCLCYGIFVALSGEFFKKYDRFWITTWLFIFTTIGLSLVALPEMMAFHWPAMTPLLWWSFLYGIFGSSLMGYFLVVWVVAHAPASKIALCDYLQPVVVTVLAAVFLLEKITPRMMGGSSLIFLGVLMTLVQLPDSFRISRRMS